MPTARSSSAQAFSNSAAASTCSRCTLLERARRLRERAEVDAARLVAALGDPERLLGLRDVRRDVQRRAVRARRGARRKACSTSRRIVVLEPAASARAAASRAFASETAASYLPFCASGRVTDTMAPKPSRLP